MKKCSILFWTLAGLVLSAAGLRADILVRSESSRVYMDTERKQTGELWLAPGKSTQKSGNRLFITREDLDKWWTIDLGQKTYWEASIKDAQPPSTPPKPDIHDLWLYYEPEYEWKITDTGKTKEIDGRNCRRYDVEGLADFASITATYWLADAAGIPGALAYRDHLVGQLAGDTDREGLLKLLAANPKKVPFLREETLEHSIAPVRRQTFRIVAIEEAAAPAGTYDLPAGLKKMESGGN